MKNDSYLSSLDKFLEDMHLLYITLGLLTSASDI